ncbi:hypothetical protein VNO77_38925 [Canavalia gladiata]|uniref:Uncharacterized protein n=1 Tax=Canavalia gladiata TaxID=3824 RepID=A0AAN9PVD0_CANGL
MQKSCNPSLKIRYVFMFPAPSLSDEETMAVTWGYIYGDNGACIAYHMWFQPLLLSLTVEVLNCSSPVTNELEVTVGPVGALYFDCWECKNSRYRTSDAYVSLENGSHNEAILTHYKLAYLSIIGLAWVCVVAPSGLYDISFSQEQEAVGVMRAVHGPTLCKSFMVSRHSVGSIVNLECQNSICRDQ